jgi:hypothetical protein
MDRLGPPGQGSSSQPAKAERGASADTELAAASVRPVRNSVEEGYNRRNPEAFDAAYHPDAIGWNNGVLLDDASILEGSAAIWKPTTGSSPTGASMSRTSSPLRIVLPFAGRSTAGSGKTVRRSRRRGTGSGPSGMEGSPKCGRPSMSEHRVFSRRTLTVAALLLFMAAPVHAQRTAQSVVSDPFYPATFDATLLARLVDDELGAARAAVERLVTVTAARTAANTLRPFDEARNHETIAQGLANIAIHLHPDSALRAAGLEAEERISRFHAEVATDPRIARALEALDTSGPTAEERLLAARLRRDYRRAGADRDEDTRSRLRSYFETMDGWPPPSRGNARIVSGDPAIRVSACSASARRPRT